MQVSHTQTFMSSSQWLGHLLHYFTNAKKNKKIKIKVDKHVAPLKQISHTQKFTAGSQQIA